MMTRLITSPSAFGKVLAMVLNVIIFSASSIKYVPKYARLPPLDAITSSDVGVRRFFEAKSGRSDLNTCQEKWPLGDKMNIPRGASPHSGVPSARFAFDVQTPRRPRFDP